MRDLLQEKDRTREAVSQIVSWCLVIALHQTEGIGKKRQDDVAAKALVIQEAAAKRLARQSREKVIAWLRSKLDRLDLPDGALTFRVPLRRAPKSRREKELRIAGDQAATLTWLIFALAIHRALHFGAQRLVRLHTATLENYRQFSDWELDGADWAFSRLQHCAQQALQEELDIVETPEDAPTAEQTATAYLRQTQMLQEQVGRVIKAAQLPSVTTEQPLAVLSTSHLQSLLKSELPCDTARNWRTR